MKTVQNLVKKIGLKMKVKKGLKAVKKWLKSG